ncbi:UDP-N-acetylmuramate dehydrogenase [Dermabacteraceae bacterium P13095]
MASLADFTTLRVGGQIDETRVARNEEELIAAVSEADAAGRPLLVIGGGSNLVPDDAPFAGTVVLVEADGQGPTLSDSCDISPNSEGKLPPSCGGVTVEHFAGVRWDDAVRFAVENELLGTECLSGIPGTVGATPVQNVGAYGQDVSTTISRVRTWDRHENQIRTFFASDCGFGYRTSVFKRTPYEGQAKSATGRYVVLSVQFQHTQGDMAKAVVYPELAQELGIEVGERAPLQRVREAVLAIRTRKAMVSLEEEHDTWSAGSFFTNPILTAEQSRALPLEAPRFAAGSGANGEELVKTSAAWLIARAGFAPGYGVNERATLSTRHTLALTNRGNANAADIRELARAVRAGVEEKFGIRLDVEPVQIGEPI